MDSIYSIYLITNKVNQKKYIGFSNDPTRRWKHHINGIGGAILLKHALEKYGFENFIFEIICQGKDKNYMLNIMEPYFIKKYDSFAPNGYNLTSGGDGGGIIFTDEIKKKISNALKGKKFSKERKERMSISRRGKRAWNKDKTGIYSQDTLDKMSSKKARTYKITKVDGEILIITGLKRFCNSNNYNKGDLFRARKRNKPYKDILSVEEIISPFRIV